MDTAISDEEREALLAMRRHCIAMKLLIEARLGISPGRSEKVLEPDKEDRNRTRTYHHPDAPPCGTA